MPGMIVRRAEQPTTRYRQPAALDFTFGMNLVVRNLPNDPYNEVDTEIGYLTVEGVDAQDAEKDMEDNNDDDIKYDNSRETDEADCIRDDDNQTDNTDGGIQTMEPTRGVPQEEPAGPSDGGLLVEYVTLEETERDEEVSM